MHDCLDEWFRLGHEGSISWRSVADMCAGAYQILIYHRASATELNHIAQAWEKAVQLHEYDMTSIRDLEYQAHA